MFKTPFRKILTRKYRFCNGKNTQKLVFPKRKRDQLDCSISDDENSMIPSNKKRKLRDSQNITKKNNHSCKTEKENTMVKPKVNLSN